MSEVIPGLWVSSAAEAGDLQFLRARGIKYVLNCAEEWPEQAAPAGCVYHKQSMLDEEDGAEPEDIIAAAWKVKEWRDLVGGSVLVHCMAGMSRSPTVAIAYMILFQGATYEMATWKMQRARNFIRIIPYFEGILMGLESIRDSVVAKGPPQRTPPETAPYSVLGLRNSPA